MQINQRLKLQ